MSVIIKFVDSLDFDHHPNRKRDDHLPTGTEPTPMSDLKLFTPSTLYGGGAAGYIDYPTLAESSTRAN